ncbi:probable receptor-like protein kinase At1g11050 [Cornus florida]|uniref:probable receptor-like protein kinase At1g11050 n=1 Tax=Cornus florida TaxID=4283 RepID=UPI00289A43B8|nr:probable receptor-like protein kinase At1g11050 [Cornus florida]
MKHFLLHLMHLVADLVFAVSDYCQTHQNTSKWTIVDFAVGKELRRNNGGGLVKGRDNGSVFTCSTIISKIKSIWNTLEWKPSPTACVLNLTSFPFEPTGRCIGTQNKVQIWDSFKTSLCCQNALTVLSKALAQHARDGEGNIFLDDAHWKNCSGPFLRQSVSVQSCRLSDLVQGSSRCSGLSLSIIRQEQTYQDALKKCSQFNSSFDDSCQTCTAAITTARDNLLDLFKAKGKDSEKKLCGVATVTSIAAELMDDHSSVEDFYSCLYALDVLDPGYIRMKYSLVKAILAILIATIGIMLVVMLIKYATKNKPDPKHVQTKEIATWSGLYRFSRAEIDNAIGPEREFLGRGSAGHVYKGTLPSGQHVAIKQINKNTTSDSFTREVEGLSKVRHPNLVCLFGCCTEGGEQYLVYEYCSEGNLAQHLLKKDNVLPWQKRVQIVRDCALALRYLHHHIDGCIVHRDIKLTNILLTGDLQPKLSDFGLAKMLGMEESKVFTDVRGTIGYMDPEYMSNAKLTCASDIYSFGIVALQLLSGQKVIELDLDARDQLTRKAKDVSIGKRPLTDFIDSRLNGVNYVDFESILQVAVLCVAGSSNGRPTIDVVFEEMEKAWKNTIADMKGRREMSSSATSQSRLAEVMPV